MNAQEQAQLEEKMEEFLMAGGTMHELYGITQKELDALYIKGFQEYNAQQYEKAKQIFAYLLYLNSDEAKYWFAFGAVLHVFKRYEEALCYYAMAADKDILEPIYTLHMVECFIGLEKHSEALEALAILLKETESDPKQSELYAKALAYQTLLTQKKHG